nr:PP2C family serine/threonine-protein phosphatase [Neobacillus paridis]
MTDKGDKREYNEDFIDGFEHEGVLFLLVADGQGAHKGGQTASAVAGVEIRKYIEEVYKRGMEKDLETVLKRAVYVAHRVVEGVRKGDMGSYHGLCTSLTLVALQQSKKITFVHIGNTKFFLLREGNLIQMTTDHTVTEQLLKVKKITKEEALIHPERAYLTKGIGIFPKAEPDIVSGAVAKEDILILVSDGITEHLAGHEIAELVLKAGNNETACDYLIKGANERGGYDNLSAMISYINF